MATDVEIAAASIMDVMMGGDRSWRERKHEVDASGSTLLESEDWRMAERYARAALSGRHPTALPVRPDAMVANGEHVWTSWRFGGSWLVGQRAGLSKSEDAPIRCCNEETAAWLARLLNADLITTANENWRHLAQSYQALAEARLFTLRMVHKNNEVRAGRGGRAWDGDHVAGMVAIQVASGTPCLECSGSGTQVDPSTGPEACGKCGGYGVLLSKESRVLPELKGHYTSMMPPGIFDDSTYEQVEDRLDKLEAPHKALDGRRLNLVERLDAYIEGFR